MARKSRQVSGIQESKVREVNWHCALYIRLSREDGDKEESDSIKNQKTQLLEFLAEQEEMELFSLYIDDGYTGTNFERPAFIQMMQDIRDKKVNCVIVKDLSRFGRNYIEAGKYMEQIFPFLQVRFISINDYLDSVQNPGSMNTILVPFKNLMNDEYCRDISNKIRSTLNAKRKKGEFIGAFAAYGYCKDINNKNKLLIDENTAPIVQQIYTDFLSGYSILGITKKLNELGILNPSAYKKTQGLSYKHPVGERNDCLWSDSTVRRILKNRLYTGDLVQGKNRVQSYKVKRLLAVPEEEWMVAENTHEAIITKEEYERVQALLLRDTRTAPQKREVYLFSGFLRCMDCKRAMNRKTIVHDYGSYTYYICSTYKKASIEHCTKHTIRAEQLEELVLNSINKQIALAVSMEELLEEVKRQPIRKQRQINIAEAIKKRKNSVDKLKDLRNGLYEDWKSGELSKEEYRELKRSYQEKIQKEEEKLTRLQREEDEYCQAPAICNPYLPMLQKYGKLKKLTREILTELVDCIWVSEGGGITIAFKFADAFQKTAAYLEEQKQALTGFTEKLS